MNSTAIDLSAPKKPTNVTINSDLLKAAKSFEINLSQTLETRLLELVKEKQRNKWLEENREALEAYNARIDEHGIFGEDLRRF